VFLFSTNVTNNYLLYFTLILIFGLVLYINTRLYSKTDFNQMSLIVITFMCVAFLSNIYFLMEIYSWLNITQEGTLTYKFLKIIKKASYDLKLETYTNFLQHVINEASTVNPDFGKFVYNNPVLLDYIPTTKILNLPLDQMTTLANQRFNVISNDYKIFRDAINKVSSTSVSSKELQTTLFYIASCYYSYLL
jgi:hypothetical protein